VTTQADGSAFSRLKTKERISWVCWIRWISENSFDHRRRVSLVRSGG